MERERFRTELSLGSNSLLVFSLGWYGRDAVREERGKEEWREEGKTGSQSINCRGSEDC